MKEDTQKYAQPSISTNHIIFRKERAFSFKYNSNNIKSIRRIGVMLLVYRGTNSFIRGWLAAQIAQL